MKEKAEMTREELIALGWMKKPSDKMQEKPKNQLTAVEFLLRELKKYGDTCPNYEINYVIEIPTHILTELEEQAKEMEKEQIVEAWYSAYGGDAHHRGEAYYIETFKTKSCCDNGIIICAGCDGDKKSEFGICAGCIGVGEVVCGKCNGNTN